MLRGFRAKCDIFEDWCELSQEEIYEILCENDKIHRFIDKGSRKIQCKAPWDEIGITYSFNIANWASNKYSYANPVRWKDKF